MVSCFWAAAVGHLGFHWSDNWIYHGVGRIQWAWMSNIMVCAGAGQADGQKSFRKKNLSASKKKNSFWNEIGNGGGISRRLRYPHPPFHFEYATKISSKVLAKCDNEIQDFGEEMLYRTTSEVGTQQQAVISCVGYSTELPYTYCIKLTGISGRVFTHQQHDLYSIHGTFLIKKLYLHTVGRYTFRSHLTVLDPSWLGLHLVL